MNGSEFLKKVKKYARDNNVSFEFVPSEGKGSHGTLYLGGKISTVKDRKKEIGKGLLVRMCKQLGISQDDLK
ncbi:MAG: type II toxin-antitoxin system HicA family toxin [Geminicoccaceae bacterium]